MSARGGTFFTGHPPMEVSVGTDRRGRSKIYCHTSGRAGVAHGGPGEPTAAQHGAQKSSTRYQARTTTSEVADVFTTVSISDNELAARVKHEGIRAGEIMRIGRGG